MAPRSSQSSPFSKATSRTTPRHIWMHEVYAAAGVSLEDGERYCGRARLNRWYSDEMEVWIAADSLRSFVQLGKREERLERSGGELRRMLIRSVLGPRRERDE